MIEVQQQVNAVRREVGGRTLEAGEARVVTISRVYETDVDDLWEAVTSAERIPRWLLPVSGELRLGGRYQLEGNAGGEVLSCDPPHAFDATWEYGGATSWIEVRITSVPPRRAQLELTHIALVDEQWEEFGPGATGIGWDLALLGLHLHLRSGDAVDPAESAAWAASPDGARFMALSSERWGEADAASGTDPEVARAAAARTLAAYTGAEAREDGPEG